MNELVNTISGIKARIATVTRDLDNLLLRIESVATNRKTTAERKSKAKSPREKIKSPKASIIFKRTLRVTYHDSGCAR